MSSLHPTLQFNTKLFSVQNHEILNQDRGHCVHLFLSLEQTQLETFTVSHPTTSFSCHTLTASFSRCTQGNHQLIISHASQIKKKKSWDIFEKEHGWLSRRRPCDIVISTVGPRVCARLVISNSLLDFESLRVSFLKGIFLLAAFKCARPPECNWHLILRNRVAAWMKPQQNNHNAGDRLSVSVLESVHQELTCSVSLTGFYFTNQENKK